jgi:hypothetical protein
LRSFLPEHFAVLRTILHKGKQAVIEFLQTWVLLVPSWRCLTEYALNCVDEGHSHSKAACVFLDHIGLRSKPVQAPVRHLAPVIEMLRRLPPELPYFERYQPLSSKYLFALVAHKQFSNFVA